MELGLTFPLQRQLRRNHLPYGTEEDLRHCWDLHGITLQGRSCLLAVHCATRYTFTLYDLSPFQWDALEETFLQGLQQTAQSLGITLPAVESLVVTRTHGRRPIAFLNRAWEDVVALDYALDTDSQSQEMLDYAVNTKVCNCAGFEGKGQPLQRFLSLF